MLITNTSIQSNTQNFKGDLRYEGVNFTLKKLEEVAQQFKAQTEYLSDARLKFAMRDVDGKPWHYTIFQYDGVDFASIPTCKYRRTFESSPVDKIVKLFVRFARAARREQRAEKILDKMRKLKNKQETALKQAETYRKMGREKLAADQEALAQKLTLKVNKKREEFAKKSIIKIPVQGGSNWEYE